MYSQWCIEREFMECLEDKVAVIIGGTSGIGFETALLFAKYKTKVVVSGRNKINGDLLVRKIIQEGGEAIFINVDVTKPESISNLIGTAIKHFGGIDFAFNNAGIEGDALSIVDMNDQNWDQVINTNLKGLYSCLKYELSAIISRGGGAIVNTSTSLTKLGLPKAGAYIASKAGVDALTRVAAIEYGSYGIRVNAVNPGSVHTPMLRRLYNSKQIAKMEAANPLLKIASPKDIAETVLWLCSSKANHINGQCIVIDGGEILNC